MAENTAETPTAPIVAAGLIGGWLTARASKNRPLGGVVLAAAGAAAGRRWAKKTSPAVTAGLTGVYLAAFGLSHPLAKKIGAWPSVLAVSGVAAGAAWLMSDSK